MYFSKTLYSHSTSLWGGRPSVNLHSYASQGNNNASNAKETDLETVHLIG